LATYLSANPQVDEIVFSDIQFDSNVFNKYAPFAASGLIKKLSIVTTTGNLIIAEQAFRECSSIETIDFVTSVGATLSIGPTAFYECTNLKNIALSGDNKTITNIESTAFGMCTKLTGFSTSGVIIDQLTGNNAFSGCSSLTYEGIRTNLRITGCR
jgi:hypothetical protein